MQDRIMVTTVRYMKWWPKYA